MALKSKFTLTAKDLGCDQLSEQEIEYITGVVVKALHAQSMLEKSNKLDTSLSIAHNEYKTTNPKAIKNLDTFGLVSEAMGTVKDLDDMLEEIRDHGPSYAQIRIVADMGEKRFFDNIVKDAARYKAEHGEPVLD